MQEGGASFVTLKRVPTVASATLSYVGLFGYNCSKKNRQLKNHAYLEHGPCGAGGNIF